jgi:preprotein translocase SecE subunit
VSAAEIRKKPRIRKSAPTVRQRVEAASAKAEQEPPQRVRKALTRAASPVRKVGSPLRRAPIPAPVKTIFRTIARVLKWLVPKYFVNSWREVRQVAWPNRRETWRLTLAVFIFAAVFGALVALVDKGLDAVFKNLILK